VFSTFQQDRRSVSAAGRERRSCWNVENT